MRKPDEVRIYFGPNVLAFDEVEDALAFAREQGCAAVSYWPIYRGIVSAA